MNRVHSKVLALDVGTSGTRGAVFGARGDVIAAASVAYTASYDANGFAELDPEEILAAVGEVMLACLREAGPADLISPGTFMHSLVLTDENFKPLTPLSIWADRRAAPQCEQARSAFTRGDWRYRTGCPLSPSFPLYRLLWFREHQPELFGSFRFALSVKSFLLARLAGRALEDFSGASGSGLFNLRERAWDPEILSFLRLSSDRLPEVLPGRESFVGIPTIVGAPTPEAGGGELFRLIGGAEWLPGGADGPLAHLAGAGRTSDTISLSIGTSMAARIGLPEGDLPPAGDSSAHEIERRSSDTWCYVLDDGMFVKGIARNNGGNVLEWYVREHYPGGRLEDERVVASADYAPELICVSELHRERAQDERTLGFLLLGVRPEHTADQKLRAVVEGMTFQAIEMVEELTAGREVKRIILSGSLTESPLIQEVLAGLLEPELIRVRGQNASLEGARMLAAKMTEPDLNGSMTIAPGARKGERPDYRAKYEKWKALRRLILGEVRRT